MVELFHDMPLAQAVGYAGTVAGMSWPLFRGRTSMLLVQLAATVLFAAHYALTGAPTGAVMNVLAALQVLAAVPLATRPQFRWVYLAVLPFIAAGVVATWHGVPSLFAALGLTFISLGRYQTDVVRFRLFMALALPCWFGHNLIVWSVPGMMSDVVATVINATILLRMAPWRRVAAVQEG